MSLFKLCQFSPSGQRGVERRAIGEKRANLTPKTEIGYGIFVKNSEIWLQSNVLQRGVRFLRMHPYLGRRLVFTENYPENDRGFRRESIIPIPSFHFVSFRLLHEHMNASRNGAQRNDGILLFTPTGETIMKTKQICGFLVPIRGSRAIRPEGSRQQRNERGDFPRPAE